MWIIYSYFFDIKIKCNKVSKNVQTAPSNCLLIHLKHFYSLKWKRLHSFFSKGNLRHARHGNSIGAYSNLQWDQQRIAFDSQTNFPSWNSYGWHLTSLRSARYLKGASLDTRTYACCRTIAWYCDVKRNFSLNSRVSADCWNSINADTDLHAYLITAREEKKVPLVEIGLIICSREYPFHSTMHRGIFHLNPITYKPFISMS